MSASVSGYEYDIFISYRHNDNLDGWVTDFVQNLNKELQSTLKNAVTIYFDRSPHDGLLETYNVDKSLQGKLKCLIFIPIISQTYCDTASFAWQHEFCAFNKLVKEDQFGRDIKLSNGNVTSRILAIKIHDLDVEDKTLLESELGGALRAIEFIYKEAGVNRPLKIDDFEAENLNGTRYRNQLNKVANAIKEIINALKYPAHQATPIAGNTHLTVNTRSTFKWKALIGSVVLIVAAALAYFAYKTFADGEQRTTTIEELSIDKSIAVLPFDNLSSDTLDYLSEGLTDQLITSLAHLKDIKVASRTSVMKYKGSPLKINEIAGELKVSYILEGSVQKGNKQLRISTRLIRAEDNKQEWSKAYNQKFDDILAIQDEISLQVASELGQVLNPTVLKQDKPSNTEAYDHFLQGEFLWRRVDSKSIRQAIREFKIATKLDTTFANGYARIAFGYLLLASAWGDSKLSLIIDSAKYFNNNALRLNPKSYEALHAESTILWWSDRNVDEAERLLLESIHQNTNAVNVNALGFLYNTQGRLEEGLRYSSEGHKLDPAYLPSMTFSGDSYFLLKQYDKAEEIYKQAVALYPNNSDGMYRLVWLYCNTKRYAQALEVLASNEKHAGIRDPRLSIYLAVALNKTGRIKESSEIITELTGLLNRKVAVFDLNLYLAVYCSATNQRDKMYSYLEQSVKENDVDLIWLKVDPVFEEYRQEPKFQALLQKVGF